MTTLDEYKKEKQAIEEEIKRLLERLTTVCFEIESGDCDE